MVVAMARPPNRPFGSLDDNSEIEAVPDTERTNRDYQIFHGDLDNFNNSRLCVLILRCHNTNSFSGLW